MLIQELNHKEIDLVSGGKSITDDWRTVTPEMWSMVFGELAYPDVPPKYRDEENPNDNWVYD